MNTEKNEANTPSGAYVTRAEFIQLLYVALDLRQNRSTLPAYSDVNFGDWYYNAVASAKQTGLLYGLAQDNEPFDPNAPMTRRDMTVVLSNIAIPTEAAPVRGYKASDFSDYEEIGDAYIDAVIKAVNAGLLNANGAGDGKFSPNSFVTRAQAALIQNSLTDVLRG